MENGLTPVLAVVADIEPVLRCVLAGLMCASVVETETIEFIVVEKFEYHPRILVLVVAPFLVGQPAAGIEIEGTLMVACLAAVRFDNAARLAVAVAGESVEYTRVSCLDFNGVAIS